VIEIVYKQKEPIVDPAVLETLRISPSSISTYNKCPREWYYRYIEAVPSVETIHLVRGNIVHNTFDKFFNMNWIPNGENYRQYCLDKSFSIFEKEWDEAIVKLPDLSEEDNKKYRKESKFMVERFINNLCDTVEDGLASGKFTNASHGYNSLKPKFKEYWLDDEKKMFIVDDTGKRTQIPKDLQEPLENSLHIGGYLDSAQVNNGKTILIDYKTSNKYKEGFDENYIIQLSIYAYLWNKQFGAYPDYLCVKYLKFNESFYFPVTPSLIKTAILEIKKMRFGITQCGLEKENYPIKKNHLCGWCQFEKTCFGSDIDGN